AMGNVIRKPDASTPLLRREDSRFWDWRTVYVTCAAVVTALTAAFALVGWIVASPALKGVWQPVPMSPTTAVCLLMSALSLWLVRAAETVGWQARLAWGLAVIVATVGALKLIELCVGWESGIDSTLFRSQLNGNRIAPNTALCFLLAGSGLAMLDWKSALGRGPAALLFLGAAAVAMPAVAGQ